MTCRHCGEPIRACLTLSCICKGWRHRATAEHDCSPFVAGTVAEPEPGGEIAPPPPRQVA